MHPQGVPLRLVAVLGDLIVTVPLFIAFVALLGERIDSPNGSVFYNLSGWPFIAYLLTVAAYYAVCERRWGMTLGKRMVGLRVVASDGSRLTPKQAVIRNVVRLIDLLPLLYLVGATSIWISKENQRLGDKAAGTIVVKSRPESEPHPVMPDGTWTSSAGSQSI
ncbi:MAG: Integral rane protein [Thermoleophilia bacterium]|nr:Integral rane protein [Thermoleophilia bacterium]